MTNEALENLMVRLMGDGSSYQRMIHQAQESTSRLADQIQFHSRRIQGFGLTLRGFGQTALGTAAGYAGVLGIGASINAVEGAVTRFMDQEKTEIAFTALIGNAELAQKTLGDLRKFAAETPFESPEIMAAAKQMIAFGESAENILPTMKALGDVSAGLNIPLGQLTYLFGTLKAQGRAMTVDINQFAMRGIPIWAELEKITGKNNAEVRKMVEAGQVGFPMVEQAFQNMTKEGGRFHGQLEKQSQSLAGLVSTLKDNVGMMLADVGEKFVKAFGVKDVIKNLGDAAQEAGRWIGFGFDKAVDLGNAVREWVNTTGVQWLRDVADAVKAWATENSELVTKIGIVSGAIAGVVGAFYLLKTALLTTLGIASLLRVQQVASLGVWLLEKAAILAAAGVLAVYTGVKWALTAAATAATAAIALFAGGEGIATGATTILSAAIAILEAETVVPLVIALVAAGAALAVAAVALAALGTGLYTVVKVGMSVLGILSAIPTTEGPIKVVGDMFNEWGDNLQRIAEVAKTDLPGAFELFKLAARVAMLQVRDYFPALWGYVVNVSDIVWKEVKSQAVIAFAEAIGKIWNMLVVLFNNIKSAVGVVFDPLAGPKALQKLFSKNEVKEVVDKGLDLVNTGKHWKLQMKDALEEMKRSLVESGDLGTARDALRKAFDLQDMKMKWRAAAATMGFDAAAAGKKAAENMAPVPLKLVPKFDAAEWGSAEMHARIAEWRDRMNISPNSRKAAEPFVAPTTPGLASDFNTEADNNLTRIFKKIEENTRNYAAVSSAGLKGDDFAGGEF